MIKPTSFHCNLACQYCFYLDKNVFLRKEATELSPFMQIEQAKEFMEHRIQLEAEHDVYFTWQGGEPLLAGLEFYQKIVSLGQIIANKYDKNIYHAIQTNGTLIDEQWAKFFHKNRILIGISIDGDAELHDIYRRTPNGNNTFAAVERGITILKEAGVAFNTLTVVNRENVKHPLRVYRFLKKLGVKFMQFIPVVETVGVDKEHKPNWLEQKNIIPEVADFSVLPIEYGTFMVTIFNEWVRNDITDISIRLFDSMIAQFMGQEATLCVFKEKCGGDNIALEVGGEMYQCDHFVYPSEKFRLGNLQHINLVDLEEKLCTWSTYKSDISGVCIKCQWQNLCHGGCPKHRFIDDGQGGRKNYFCEGYKYLFKELTPGLNLIAEFIDKKIPWEYLSEAVDRVYAK